jgi:hypothetical protein
MPKKCSKCGIASIEDDAAFCHVCGNALSSIESSANIPKTCSKCGVAIIDEDAAFCHACGNALSTIESSSSPSGNISHSDKGVSEQRFSYALGSALRPHKRKLWIILGIVIGVFLSKGLFSWSGCGSGGFSTQQHQQTSSAPKQMVIHSFDKIKYSDCNAEHCKDKCNSLNQPLSEYMSKGWRVVTSTPHEETLEVLLDSYDYPCGGIRSLGPSELRAFKQCTCIGKEYVIER